MWNKGDKQYTHNLPQLSKIVYDSDEIIRDSRVSLAVKLIYEPAAGKLSFSASIQVFRFCVENSIEEKVIEKAYKKLRLDALVIQQGRLTENTKTKVNKEDLLNMVRYGAELVFSSEVRNSIMAL